MTTRRALLGAFGAAAVGATGFAGSAFAAGPSSALPGPLVLVGGGLADDNAAVYGEIVRRAGGKHARIGVLTAASIPESQDPDAGTPDAANSVANGAFYRDLLLSYGAGHAEWIPVDLDHTAAADDRDTAATAASMTGFFFGGGDQFRYVTCLLHGDAGTDTRVMAAIRRAHRAGAVIAGSSAGADIQQGHDMVTGGDSYPALRDGSTPGYYDDASVSAYWPAGGFGFFTAGLLDTHFNAYGRLGRAIVLARTVGRHRFFGIDPDTALVVEHPRTDRERHRVIGTAGVSVINVHDTISWNYLTDGARYDAATGRIQHGPAVSALTPSAGPVTPSADIFADWAQLDLALALAASTDRTATGYTLQTAPQFAVELTKGRGFHAYTRNGTSADSFRDITVGIRTIPA